MTSQPSPLSGQWLKEGGRGIFGIAATAVGGTPAEHNTVGTLAAVRGRDYR